MSPYSAPTAPRPPLRVALAGIGVVGGGVVRLLEANRELIARRAGRPIEHPGRNLQPSPGSPTSEAATQNLSASLLNHLMNMDQASGPRMPRIKKLALRDPWAFRGRVVQ